MAGKYAVIPPELVEAFEASSFCPHDAIRGQPQTGTAWSSIAIDYDSGNESSYPETDMYYVCHWNGEVTKAERPWGSMSGKYDAIFVKAVVEWFQSMTQAGRGDS